MQPLSSNGPKVAALQLLMQLWHYVEMVTFARRFKIFWDEGWINYYYYYLPLIRQTLKSLSFKFCWNQCEFCYIIIQCRDACNEQNILTYFHLIISEVFNLERYSTDLSSNPLKQFTQVSLKSLAWIRITPMSLQDQVVHEFLFWGCKTRFLVGYLAESKIVKLSFGFLMPELL